MQKHIRQFVNRLSFFLRPLYVKYFLLLNCISVYNLWFIAGKKAAIFQSVIIILGFLFSTFLTYISVSDLKRLIVPFYIGICGLLGLVSIIGTRINGARRWLHIGIFTLQPTELLKLAFILILALYFDFNTKLFTTKYKYTFFDLIIPILILTPLLFILHQPDLGSAIICFLIVLSILFFMGIGRKTMIILLLLFSLGGIKVWNNLHQYQRERVLTFLSKIPHKTSWQKQQSIIAFNSGGIFGRGAGKGIQTQLGFLPEAETDFALSAMGEEHGFISIAFVFILIYLIIIELIFIARFMKDRFSIILTAGFIFWFIWQAIINSLMIVGLIPIVGIPFPLISEGGSSILAFTIGLCLIVIYEKKLDNHILKH